MISRDEMLNLANLSKLYLSEDEIEDAMKEMDGMIDFANQINEMSLDSYETPNINGLSNALRDDKVMDSYTQNKILENVGGGKDGYFYIKKYNWMCVNFLYMF